MKTRIAPPARLLLLALPLCSTLARDPTPAEAARLKALVQQESDLRKKLKEVEDQKNQLASSLDPAPAGPQAPGLATNAPPGTDSLAADFAQFRKDYHLMVRQSVFDKAGKQEPALFQYTMPASGSNSWLADVGVGIGHDLTDLPGSPVWTAQADYHYNGAAGALKDSFVGATGLDFLLGSSTATAQKVSLNGGYKRDNVVSGEGFTGSLYWYPSYENASHTWGVGEFLIPFGWVTGRLTPFVGAEVESGNGVFKNFQRGHRTSARAGVTLTGLILPNYFGNRLETNLTYGWWNNVDTSGGYDAYDSSQSYFSGVVTYWLDRGKDGANTLTEDEKHFGLSAKYTNGDNPTKGEFNADVWTFGLSIKF